MAGNCRKSGVPLFVPQENERLQLMQGVVHDVSISEKKDGADLFSIGDLCFYLLVSEKNGRW